MSGGKAVAVAVVVVSLVLVVVFFLPSMVEILAPQTELDTDGDGTPDRIDEDDDDDGMPDEWESTYGFDTLDPLDAAEDADSDDLVNLDEFLAVTDPLDPDTDSDRTRDGTDIDPRVDVILVFQFTHYKMEDPGDIFGGEVDVYFKIRANDVEETSDVIYFDTDDADVPIDFTFVYDAPDDSFLVEIAFSWFDKDLFFDDKLDVSGVGNTCDITYSFKSHTWSGDTSIGRCSGNDDGSVGFDEDDITVDFEIYDSLGHAEHIEEILSDMGSEHGIEDFNEMARAYGHIILDNIIDWCMDHPEFFLKYGSWGAVASLGLQILGIVVYWYDETYLQNQDGP